jgi:UDP-GlcNAc:undecaprenyl-phosphate/decaprenyl-phosphate GlcNAc-1-phosphate transferase
MPTMATFLAFLVTILFMFALRPMAIAARLVDVPGGRKRHGNSVPVIGGIAMSIGLGVGTSLIGAPAWWTPVLIAIYLLVVVGTIDDRFDLPANVRLVAQSCAALLVVFAARIVVIDLGDILGHRLNLGPLGVPFTILFVITLINAFNLIDGLDGLAGGLALLSLVVMSVISIGTPLFPLVTLAAGVVAGYLLFNLPLGINAPVRTFMGDAGSTALGLIIATIGIYLTQGPASTVSPIVALWFVAVPVFDLFATVVRRLLNRRSPFAPDREHLHHRLGDHGLSRRATLVCMLGLAALYAAVGVVGNVLAIDDSTLLVLWLASGVLYYQIQRFSHGVVAVLLWFRHYSPDFLEEDLDTEER